MSDFLLDLRPQCLRNLNRAAEALQFAEDTKTFVIDRPAFGLVITQTGNSALWAPYCAATGSLVAVAGRPVFDEVEWDGARAIPGSGGLAARIIYSRVQKFGAAALEQINGNCAVIVYDAPRQLVHLATDPCGVFPAFEVEAPEGPVYCSHPDVLADAANERHRLDESSLAEFILSGTVTPPYSYYERIRAADSGTIFTIDVSGDRPGHPSKRRYFEFAYRGDSSVPEEDLASQLAAALRRAVERRTLPRLGPICGGTEWRVGLSRHPGLHVSTRSTTFAFSCFDEPNRELRTAEKIARTLSVPFLPLRRGRRLLRRACGARRPDLWRNGEPRQQPLSRRHPSSEARGHGKPPDRLLLRLPVQGTSAESSLALVDPPRGARPVSTSSFTSTTTPRPQCWRNGPVSGGSRGFPASGRDSRHHQPCSRWKPGGHFRFLTKGTTSSVSYPSGSPDGARRSSTAVS